MKIFKTLISFTDDHPGTMYLYDTIEYDGKFWVVPEWLINRTLGKRQPVRIIPLDQFEFEGSEYDEPDSKFPAHFFLKYSVPSAVFNGKKDTEFFAIEHPDIFDDAPEPIH